MIVRNRRTALRGFALLLVSTFLISTISQTAWARASHQRRSGTSGGKTYKTKTVRMAADRKSLDWDLSIKKKYYKGQLAALKKKGIRIDNNRAMVGRLRRILNVLKKKSLIPDLPYEVHYVDHKTVNATCYPGGGILFFKGLFNKKNGLVNPGNDSEIAAVMAHEISHATLRHAYRRKKTATALQIIGLVGSVATGAAGADVGRIFNVVFDVSTGVYFPAYSRKHESEADLESLFMLTKTKYKPEKAVELWERAAGKRGSKTSIFSTHPADKKRADRLRKHLENIKTGNYAVK